MDTTHLIEITGADIFEVVKAAYDLSRPQGLGFLHYRPDPLDDSEAAEVLRAGNFGLDARIDYINVRSVKLTIYRDAEQRLWIPNTWYDHTEDDLEELLYRILQKPGCSLTTPPA